MRCLTSQKALRIFVVLIMMAASIPFSGVDAAEPPAPIERAEIEPILQEGADPHLQMDLQAMRAYSQKYSLPNARFRVVSEIYMQGQPVQTHEVTFNSLEESLAEIEKAFDQGIKFISPPTMTYEMTDFSYDPATHKANIMTKMTAKGIMTMAGRQVMTTTTQICRNILVRHTDGVVKISAGACRQKLDMAKPPTPI